MPPTTNPGWGPEYTQRNLLDRLQAQDHYSGLGNPKDLTIGIEHEFFLLSANNAPASHQESQKFLVEISQHPGWYVREKSIDILGPMIERVSRESENGKYCVIKYDHHPHLLEIAFSYTNSLNELHEIVGEVMKIVKESATRFNLTIGNVSSLPYHPHDPLLMSPLSTFVNLRHYRAKLIAKSKIPDAVEHSNYAAVIAATQTHIGGTRWWNDPTYIEKLYSFEPDILPLTTQGKPYDRWKGYELVFSNYPLVGYPKLQSWTLNSWITALFKSPLAGKYNDPWSSESVDDLGYFPFEKCAQPLESFLKSVRDLQIIRPKLFKTLEFRADPSQNSVEKIIQVAALRLGLCSWLLYDNNIQTRPFIEGERLWRERALSKNILEKNQKETIQTILFAKQGLEIREKDEQNYLLIDSKLESNERSR